LPISPGRRNVATYFIAFLLSESASQVLGVAVGWTVYSIHHRPFDLGLVGLVMFTPALLLVFVSGHAVDRYNRKRIVMCAAAGVAACSFALAGLAYARVDNLVLVLGVLFCQGVFRAFGNPAERTILVNIVETDAYMRVQARYASAREIVTMAAPAIGGALVAVSEVFAFVVAGTATLCAVLGFSLLHVRATIRAKNAGITKDSALDGVRFIRSKPIVLGAISLDLFAVLFGGATALLPVYSDQILHTGAVGFGILRSSSGIGAFLMAALLSGRTPNRHVGRTMLIAVSWYGVAMIVFAYSRSLWLSIAALAAAGACDMVSVVIRRGLVALNTPDAMRGRVASIESVFIMGSGQLGSFESGTAAQIFGPVLGVALGGLATLGVVVTWALAFPPLRRADRLDTSADDEVEEEPAEGVV
jgi:MFS family permease